MCIRDRSNPPMKFARIAIMAIIPNILNFFIPYDFYMVKSCSSFKMCIRDRYKGDSDFDVLPSVVECLRREDFGRYAAGYGKMNVCFITANDITGGHSGSGMFNGKGELIGLAFDGNWERCV